MPWSVLFFKSNWKGFHSIFWMKVSKWSWEWDQALLILNFLSTPKVVYTRVANVNIIIYMSLIDRFQLDVPSQFCMNFHISDAKFLWGPRPFMSETRPVRIDACIYIPGSTIVCQLLLWWTKNLPYSTNSWDTVTKVVILCSISQAPSHEPNCTLLELFPTDLVYLNMLFILEMACSAGHLKNKWHARINQLGQKSW